MSNFTIGAIDGYHTQETIRLYLSEKKILLSRDYSVENAPSNLTEKQDELRKRLIVVNLYF